MKDQKWQTMCPYDTYKIDAIGMTCQYTVV